MCWALDHKDEVQKIGVDTRLHGSSPIIIIMRSSLPILHVVRFFSCVVLAHRPADSTHEVARLSPAVLQRTNHQPTMHMLKEFLESELAHFTSRLSK